MFGMLHIVMKLRVSGSKGTKVNNIHFIPHLKECLEPEIQCVRWNEYLAMPETSDRTEINVGSEQLS